MAIQLSRLDDVLSLLVLRFHGRECGSHCAYISNLSSSSGEILDRLVAMSDVNFSVIFILSVFFILEYVLVLSISARLP